MKITFISCYADVNSYGLRLLSAVLKEAGHEVDIYFLPIEEANISLKKLNYYKLYNNRQLDVISDIAERTDMVGISLMSAYFYRAIQITEAIKSKHNVPVIWGGVHPTIMPEECIGFADIVCIGEGEESMLECVNKMEHSQDPSRIGGLWVRRKDKVIRNHIRPVLSSLDNLPHPDYDINTNYILEDNRIVPLSTAIFKKRSRSTFYKRKVRVGYRTITGRGCPYNCAFCEEPALRKLQGRNSGLVRHLSIDRVIEEFKLIQKQLPFIELISIMDDIFLSRRTEEIEYFSKIYKEEIRLPFMCLTSPLTVNERKISALVDAGMIKIGMGIQSGSEKFNREVFNRPISNKKIMEACTTINKYVHRTRPPAYDFIVDCPYEKEGDLWKTLQLIANIPRPFQINLYSFKPFLKTVLAEKLLQDKIINEEDVRRASFDSVGKIYQDGVVNFPKFVIWVFSNTNSFFLLDLFINLKFLHKLRNPFILRLLDFLIPIIYWKLRGIFMIFLDGLELLKRSISKESEGQ